MGKLAREWGKVREREGEGASETGWDGHYPPLDVLSKRAVDRVMDERVWQMERAGRERGRGTDQRVGETPQTVSPSSSPSPSSSSSL